MTSLIVSREDRVRELTQGLFRDEIVDRLFKLIHEREFELFEMYVRIANRGINGNDRDKKGETLLVAACESGSARAVQFLMDIPGTDPARRGSQYQHRNNSTAFLLPVHAAYYWKNVHKTDRDIVEVLDVLHKSGAELYIDTKLSRSSISHDYFPLELFVVYGWMERSLEAENNVPVILKLMRMGAWRVDKRRYFQTSANFADGYDAFNANTWSLIESRRALMVLKARSAGTMRGAVPKELWRKLIQMLAFT